MNLREQMALDVQSTFLNPNEFAESKIIDERELRVIVVSDYRGRDLPGATNIAPPSYAEGVSVDRIVFYVDPVELGYRPAERQRMFYDNEPEPYEVANVGDEDGLYIVTLERNHD
ncbi:hypothetical protein [Paenibacillus xanthanilyticus]|uniref:Uncharacterized protein n=1 Tax=Paenibacillus xanthanilyticus TaxID=1783531 RepID=A0ABV8KA92_9BACL